MDSPSLSESPTGMDLANICRSIATSFSSATGVSDPKHPIKLVFSGPAGAILWTMTAMNTIDDESELFERLNKRIESPFNSQHDPNAIHVRLVVYGCPEEFKLSIFHHIVQTSDLAWPKSWPVIFDHIITKHHGSIIETRVACSLSFHQVKTTVPPITALMLAAGVQASTLNPAPLVFEAFTQLIAKRTSSPESPYSKENSELHSVVILYALMREVEDAKGTQECQISNGFPSSMTRALRDLEATVDQVHYTRVRNWLSQACLAMERSMTARNGSKKAHGLLTTLYRAFCFFNNLFASPRRFKQIQNTQNEDGLHFPSYPLSAHEPASRH